MGVPTRFTQGLATQSKETLLGDYPLPSPFRTSSTPTTSYQAGFAIAQYSNDFLAFDSDDFTVAGTSSTFAEVDGLGGLGVLTPGGTTTASSVIVPRASFQFIAGQKMWFSCRLEASAVTGNQVVAFGLTKSSAGTIATTDSLLFTKAAGSTSLNLISTVGSTSTTLLTGVTTMANATFIDVGFYYDGTDLKVFVSDALEGRVASVTIGSSGTNLTNAVMTPVIEITPVATETVTVDYLLAAQEIAR
jgi:hypothetical protein